MKPIGKTGKRICAAAVAALAVVMVAVAAVRCTGAQPEIIVPDVKAEPLREGQIYLYGEWHGEQAVLNKELELWQGYYDQGARDLFIEMPYYTAEFLNIWMQEPDDAILDQIYDDWRGTLSHTPEVRDFYRAIKASCPETVFHGTDVGHQADTTGARYLERLTAEGRQDSREYAAAETCIQQGNAYYKDIGSAEAEAYRENTLAENFAAARDALADVPVVGFYGSSHTDPAGREVESGVPCMAAQLAERYGDCLHTVDLTGGAGG